MNGQFWKTALLIVSLLANAVIVGVFIGRGLSAQQEPPPVTRQPDQAPPTGEMRQWLRMTAEEIRQEISPQRRAVERAGGELRLALSARSYDHEAAVSAFKRYQEAQATLREQSQNAILARMENATPLQRRFLIQMAVSDSNARRRRQGRRDARRERLRQSPQHRQPR